MDNKILVIEDNPGSLRLLVYTLEHEGYQVITAVNGLEGLIKALEEKPDLVILDIMLPGKDGFEVCYRLRTESQTSHLPVLVLSVKDQEVDKAIALRVGADAYITKPWQRSELLTTMAAMLGRESRIPNSNNRK